jgi:hypothetical protein
MRTHPSTLRKSAVICTRSGNAPLTSAPECVSNRDMSSIAKGRRDRSRRAGNSFGEWRREQDAPAAGPVVVRRMTPKEWAPTAPACVPALWDSRADAADRADR